MARKRRLTRFRRTARLSTAFETMKPKRAGSCAPAAPSEETCVYNTKFRRPERTPERTVVENSADRRMRCWAGSTESTLKEFHCCSLANRRQINSGGKFGAAFAATCRKNGAAGTRTHPQTETVLLGTTAVIRLKGPLAHGGQLQRFRCARPKATGEVTGLRGCRSDA